MDNDFHDSPIINPYHPADGQRYVTAPFAGRAEALTRIDQHLKSTVVSGALSILGWRHSGKTSLLRHFHRTFGEHHFTIYLPLQQLALDTPDNLLLALIHGANRAITAHEITLSRLPELPEDDDALDLATWVHTEWLPALWGIIRPNRQLVLLLDDADELIKHLNTGHFSYYHQLTQTHPQLRIILSYPMHQEAELFNLSPLVNQQLLFRLESLDEDATAKVMRQPVKDRYRVSDESVTEIQKQSGGHPQFLQRFGYYFFQHSQINVALYEVTPDIVRLITPRVYADSEAELKALWEDSTDNERIVLSTISALIYHQPLDAITPRAIHHWLIETDYPLDETAINAAIRSLDYRHILSWGDRGIHLRTDLMLRWLMQNARFNNASAGALLAGATPEDEKTGEAQRPNRFIAIVVILFAVALLILFLSQASSTPDTGSIQPTVTLASPGS
jgi:hypothetical protein